MDPQPSIPCNWCGKKSICCLCVSVHMNRPVFVAVYALNTKIYRTFVLVYPPSFFVTAPIPANPTMPKVVRNGCQENSRQPAPGGCVAAMYPPPNEKAIKAPNSKLYFCVVMADGWCVSRRSEQEGNIKVRFCSIVSHWQYYGRDDA